MSAATDEILTIDEVDVYLKAGRQTFYRLAAKGQVPAFKLDGTWRLPTGAFVQGDANPISKAVDGISGGGEE